jgi:hypothetical protein
MKPTLKVTIKMHFLISSKYIPPNFIDKIPIISFDIPNDFNTKLTTLEIKA